MKIIVNNQSEKELIKRFFTTMHDLDVVENVIEMDNEYSGDDAELSAGDEYFLKNAVSNVKIEIDSSVGEIYMDETYNIRGTCVICGTETEGTFNDEPISYEGYLHLMSEGSVKNWRCESCFNKED